MGILENDLRALNRELVDDLVDRLLVARNRVGTHDDHIARADCHLAVHAVCHAGERCHALALGACRDEHGLLRRVVLQLVDVDQGSLRNLDVAEFVRNADDIDHRPALDDHLSAVLVSGVDDLLHTVHIRRKGRDDDAVLLVFRKNEVKGATHGLLGHGKARADCVGRIAENCEHAALSELRHALQIRRLAEDRRVIDLKVTRVEDDARRAEDCEGGAVRNRVVGLDEFDIEVAEGDGIAVLHDKELRGVEKAVLLKLMANQGNREFGRIDRHIQLF